jgi:hypothetical protein
MKFKIIMIGLMFGLIDDFFFQLSGIHY